MTTPYNPTPPPAPAPQPATTEPTPPSHKIARRALVGLSIVAAFFIGLMVGIGADSGDDDGATATPSAAAAEDDAEPAAEAPKPQPEPEPEPTFYEPLPEDYLLTIKVLEQACFGSAGCNVSYRIEVTSLYLEEVDPTATYELTYEVQGGEDTRINTLEITGDQYSTDDREMVSTPSEETELVAVVTDVNRRGL